MSRTGASLILILCATAAWRPAEAGDGVKLTTLASLNRPLSGPEAGLLVVHGPGVPRAQAELVGLLAETHGDRESIVVSMEGAPSHARHFRDRLGGVLVLTTEVEGSSTIVPVGGWAEHALAAPMSSPSLPVEERAYLVPGDARMAEVESWSHGLPGFVLAVQESLPPDRRMSILVQGLFVALGMPPLAPSKVSMNDAGDAGRVVVRGHSWFLGAGIVRRPGRRVRRGETFDPTVYVGCLPTAPSQVGGDEVSASGCTVTWLVDLPGERLGLLEWPADPVEQTGELVRVLPLLERSVAELRYAGPDNFLGEAVYPADARCYLTPPSARALAAAEDELGRRAPGAGFALWDCFRPKDVQRAMWALRPDARFVAPPRGNWSSHNRGTAVDLTVIDEHGRPLPAPTDHDDFSPRAALNAAVETDAALTRDVLGAALSDAGWTPLQSEWWHFDGPDAARARPLEISFPEPASAGWTAIPASAQATNDPNTTEETP